MSALTHTCGHYVFLDLSDLYRTGGKVLVDSNGQLYVGDSALLRKSDPASVSPIRMICPSCDRTIEIPKDQKEIIGVCYECGTRVPAEDLWTVCGYYICPSCKLKQKYDKKAVKLNFKSVRIPLV
jgi:hypothetical protein